MTDGRCGQFARLANENDANAAVFRQWCRKDESTRLRCSDHIKCNVFNRLSKKTERGIECAMI